MMTPELPVYILTTSGNMMCLWSTNFAPYQPSSPPKALGCELFGPPAAHFDLSRQSFPNTSVLR